MKRSVVLSFSVLFGAEAVWGQAGTCSGSQALALAALVAVYSPSLSVHDKRVISELFDGDHNATYPANQKISVKADAVVCKFSDVDLTQRSCELTFGSQKHSLKGRSANELNATLVQAGVRSDGAAGTIYESVSSLVCTIDPNAVKSPDGSGANCTFTYQ